MEELSSRTALQNSELLTDPNEQIVHLQNEHQVMLRGLQDEIGRLQQQCSSMQQQMIYQGIIPSIEDTLKQKLEELEAKLASNLEECDNLRAELCENKKLVEHLQEHVRQQDERYQEDVSARNLIVVRLRREVQEKTKAIATLTSLLYPGLDVAKEKVPFGHALENLYSKLTIESRSLPSVCNPSTATSAAYGPMPTGSLYQKLLKFQPKTDKTIASQPQCHSRLNTAEKKSLASSHTPSAHHQNGNLPPRTLQSVKTISGELSPEPLRTRRTMPCLALKRDGNSIISSPVRVTNGRDILDEP